LIFLIALIIAFTFPTYAQSIKKPDSHPILVHTVLNKVPTEKSDVAYNARGDYENNKSSGMSSAMNRNPNELIPNYSGEELLFKLLH